MGESAARETSYGRVRLAESGDAEALTTLRLAWAVEKGVEAEGASFEEQFSAWFSEERSRRIFWIAEVDGEPVGMVNLMVFMRMPLPDGVAFRDSWGYLGNLYVLPRHRARRVGHDLVASCVAYADAHDFARIVLAPSDASIPLYERAGFGPAAGLMVRLPQGRGTHPGQGSIRADVQSLS